MSTTCEAHNNNVHTNAHHNQRLPRDKAIPTTIVGTSEAQGTGFHVPTLEFSSTIHASARLEDEDIFVLIFKAIFEQLLQN